MIQSRRPLPWLPLLAAGLLLSSCKAPLMQEAGFGPDPLEPWPGTGEDSQPAAHSEAGSEPAAAAPEAVAMTVTLGEAVLRTLENNQALKVQRLDPAIQQTFETQELAVFDPVLSAAASVGRERSESRAGDTLNDRRVDADVAVTKFLPTGTEIGAELGTDRTWGTGRSEQYAARTGLSVAQALLAGRGLGPNLANLRQARLDTEFTEYELHGFAEALVARVETTYWDYVLARRQVEIVMESVRLAEQQQEDTRQRIRVGDLPETELAAAQAEVALRREALINVRSLVATLRVRLLRLIQPDALRSTVQEVTPATEPVIPVSPVDTLADHLAVAMRMRPDLNQADLLIRRGDLELVKTRNGLLPRMDLFVSLGRTGYAGSFARSAGDMFNEGHDFAVGLAFEYPIRNRAVEARHDRALLTRRQAEESLSNVKDLVREDVETAYIEVQRSRQQVDATAATLLLQEEKLRAETAKFRVGKSTALLVATAQRDLVASQVAEVEAVINYLKALTTLFLIDGSLLERRGISAPGQTGVRVVPGAE